MPTYIKVLIALSVSVIVILVASSIILNIIEQSLSAEARDAFGEEYKKPLLAFCLFIFLALVFFVFPVVVYFALPAWSGFAKSTSGFYAGLGIKNLATWAEWVLKNRDMITMRFSIIWWILVTLVTLMVGKTAWTDMLK